MSTDHNQKLVAQTYRHPGFIIAELTDALRLAICHLEQCHPEQDEPIVDKRIRSALTEGENYVKRNA